MPKRTKMSGISELQSRISKKLDVDELENILKTLADDSKTVVVEKIDFGAESKKGDSYLSTVTRFSVDFRYKGGSGDGKKTVHLIAKSLPSNIGRRKTFRSTDFFRNEVAFYTKVWPVLEAFQKSKNIKEPFEDIPRCLSSCADGENDYILMEDLTYEGFGNAERSSGLDVGHVKLIVKLFAKFHAIAFAYKDQHPAEFENIANQLEETYFGEKFRGWYEKFQGILKAIVTDAVNKELPEMYQKKLKELFDKDLFSLVCKSCSERGPLAVITHGDSWVPNFLLRYDESHSPTRVMMIDFQLTRCSSPSLDLLFFIFACTDGAFRDTYYDEIVMYYHKHFSETLKKLGSDPNLFSLSTLKDDMKHHGAFAIGMSAEAVVMSLLEDDEVSDIDEIQGEDAVPIDKVWLVHPLKTKEKRQRVADFIKQVIDYGYI